MEEEFILGNRDLLQTSLALVSCEYSCDYSESVSLSTNKVPLMIR